LLLWKVKRFAFPWGLIFPLAVVGAILGFGMREKRRVTGLLVGWIVCYGLLLVPFFLCARFRLGMIPAVILLAAWSLSHWKRIFQPTPLVFGLAVLVFVNTSYLQARTENNPQELAKRGVAALNQGRVDDAVRDLKAAVLASPRSAKYSYFLGQAYAMSGDKEHAYQLFRRSLDLGATNHRILEGIGSWFLEMELYADAAVALERLVTERPGDGDARVSLGQAYERGGDFGKAIGAYRGAIEVAPQNERAHLDLGFAYQKQGDSLSVISAWRHGTELIPDSYSLHYNLALALAQAGQYIPGLDAVEKAIRINPEEPAARSLREWLEAEITPPQE
jgi:tetratricopeptide (TPR) repeat protein